MRAWRGTSAAGLANPSRASDGRSGGDGYGGPDRGARREETRAECLRALRRPVGGRGASIVPLLFAQIDLRVVGVTAAASVAFAVCAFVGRGGRSAIAAPLLNVIFSVVLFSGVAVNRQIGPGPAFVGFSLFAAAATLPIRGVIVAGIAGVLTIVGMATIAWNEPQLAVKPPSALAYGLCLSVVTTILSVVQALNTRRALGQVVEREQRALAAEARAQESEARYRLITDSMSDLVALLDQRGRFLYASPSVERILGISPDALLREPRFDLVHPEDGPHMIEDFAEALEHGKARGAYRCRDKEGRERWIESVYDAVPGVDQTLVAIAARDVTENRALASCASADTKSSSRS